MRDLAPQPGIEPRTLHWECGVLAMGPPGKSLSLSLFWDTFLSSFLEMCPMGSPLSKRCQGLYHATDPPSFSVYQILCLASWSPLPPTSGPFKSGVLYRKSVLWFSETTFCLRIFGSNGVFKGEDPGHLDKVKVPFFVHSLRSLDSVRCEHHSWCPNIQQCDSLAHMDKPPLPPERGHFQSRVYKMVQGMLRR